MAGISSNAVISRVRLQEQAAAPATPSSGFGFLYELSDGRLYFKNDAGTEYDLAGVNPFTLNSQSANYTAVLSDANNGILHPSSDNNARTFTIPANASVAYPVGTMLTFINGNGVPNLSIAITTDTMRLAGAGTTGTRTLAANGMATALKISSTEWIISGTNLT